MRLPTPSEVLDYPEIDWKVCSLCREPWPATDKFFPRVSQKRGRGFHCWCKACFQERRREAEARRKAINP